MVIVIGGKKYGEGSKSLTNSLFQNTGTNDGYYKKLKNAIVFYAPSDTPFCALVRLDTINPFFVSCSKAYGKIRYSYGLGEYDSKKLGLCGDYTKAAEIAASIKQTLIGE